MLFTFSCHTPKGPLVEVYTHPSIINLHKNCCGTLQRRIEDGCYLSRSISSVEGDVANMLHIQIQKYWRVQQRQHTKSIKDDEEPDAVEEIATCEHSHLKSPGRNQSDDTAFSMLTLLYDVRLVLPFLQLIFQHSGNTDIKIFTMKPRRAMAIYQLYVNLLPQYGHISDTIKIIQLLLDNYSTQMLETILGGKTIITMQTQYIQKLGIQCFSQPLHWRWLLPTSFYI